MWLKSSPFIQAEFFLQEDFINDVLKWYHLLRLLSTLMLSDCSSFCLFFLFLRIVDFIFSRRLKWICGFSQGLWSFLPTTGSYRILMMGLILRIHYKDIIIFNLMICIHFIFIFRLLLLFFLSVKTTIIVLFYLCGCTIYLL